MLARLTRLIYRIAKTLAALASLWYAPALEAQGTKVREPLRKQMSPLLAAVDGNDVRKASELLASGADPNALSKSSAPLERALFNKNKEMVSLLLKHGANPRAIDTIGQSNLQIAFERDPALAAWLLKQIQNVTVIDAAEAGTLADVRKLVSTGGDVNMASNDIRHLSPLQAAVRRRDLEMAAFLLEQGADLNYRGEWGAPVLFLASTSFYSAKMTELLLRRGADPNSTDRDGLTPLCLVAETYWPDVVETLIKGGANVNFRAPDGSTPLHSAAISTDPESRVIRILVKHGAAINAQDQRGFTPLHYAVEKAFATAAMALLDLGADRTICDKKGRKPVQLVRESVRQFPGMPEVVRRLNQAP